MTFSHSLGQKQTFPSPDIDEGLLDVRLVTQEVESGSEEMDADSQQAS